jgi:hypothetical protein
MAPYSYSTFASLKTALAINLSDPNKIFWTDAELGIYLNAAFREWNSIARMFRDRGQFATNTSDLFYDLRDVLVNGDGEAFLSPVITDSQLLTQAKYMLIEPSPDNDTSFTDGFSLANFTNSFAQRRNQFLLETGLVISQPTVQVVSSGEGRVVLSDDSVIDIRRATWTDFDGNITQLTREDEFTASAFSPTWPQSGGTPQRYSIYPDPQLTMQLIPPPVDNGILTLQTISAGTVLDDFTPSILWGVLIDVLSSPGPGNDPLRIQYAEQRWAEGIVVGKQAATVMQSYINGIPVTTESVYNYDTFKPSWMVAGTPQSIGLLGSNLAAVVPKADGVYSVVMDCVRNAPQLTDDDPVTFGREYVNIFIDYATHLASFKLGGAEFQATYSAYDAFVKAAIAYNNRMSAQNLNYDTLVDKAQQQEEEVGLRKVQVAA